MDGQIAASFLLNYVREDHLLSDFDGLIHESLPPYAPTAGHACEGRSNVAKEGQFIEIWTAFSLARLTADPVIR